MSNTYTWHVKNLVYAPSSNNQENVVTQIQWLVNATDGNGNSASNFGTQSIPFNASNAFIPFKNLTEAEVLNWLTNAMGTEAISNIQAGLDFQINSQVNPVSKIGLPWASA
jgi:hypothetical protein